MGVYAKKMVMEVWVAEFPRPGWGVEEGLQGGKGRLLTSSPQLLAPSEIRGSHLPHLMILTGSIRAPSGPLCLPDQWPLSWAHPSVTRSSSCSQPLEQPRPAVTTTNWLSTAASRPLPCHCLGTNGPSPAHSPTGPAQAACCFWEGEGEPTELFREALLPLQPQ